MATATLHKRSSLNSHLAKPDQSPPLASTTSSSNSTRYSSKSSDSHRPKTAPSSQLKTPTSGSTNTLEHPIPKIAIFADALSLKKLREQYQTIRKSPTLPDLSHNSSHSSVFASVESKRPQTRRVHSATAATDAINSTNAHNTNVTAAGDLQLSPDSPQLPELNFHDRASFSRRAPASRSSNGVDTGKGPPPAIVTRSSSYTSTSDLARRAQNPAAATLAQQRDKSYNGIKSPTSDAFRHSSSPFEQLRSQPVDNSFTPFSPTAIPGSFEQSLDAIMDRESTYSDAQEYLDERASKRNSALLPGNSADEGSGESDLFLNLAQDSPAPQRISGELERRLVSFGIVV